MAIPLGVTDSAAPDPPVLRADSPALRADSHRLSRRMWRHRWHYVCLMPMLVLFVGFTLWPVAASWWYAFLDWPGYGPMNDFVGLDNFQEAFSDPLFWNAFSKTGIFALFGIFVQMPLALLIAMVLNNTLLRGRNVYRVLLFLPVVTTTAVVGVVFVLLLSPTGGAINEILIGSGLVDGPINFLGETLALPTVLVIDMWKNIGVTIIYWLAALQTIPNELYEAARVDGAGRRQIFSHITVPLLVPLGLVITLLTFVSSLNAFDIVKVMTEGGPNRATDIVQTYIYRYAFEPAGLPRYGFASATGILFGLAVMVITVMPIVLRRIRQNQIGPGSGVGKGR
jgi:raffinose/stachyose/melibiose transport system permease protein